MGFHYIPPAAVDAREIATGSYTGDGTDDRQITVGFKCSAVIVLNADHYYSNHIFIPNFCIRIDTAEQRANSALHATDGFVVYAAEYTNENLKVYYYWAISE